MRLIYFNMYINAVCDLIKYLAFKKENQLTLQKILRFFLYFAFLVNLFACIWIYLGEIEAENGWIMANQGMHFDDLDYDKDVYIGKDLMALCYF